MGAGVQAASKLLDYGALGLLALVLVGVGFGGWWFLKRLDKSFDAREASDARFIAALEKINDRLAAMAVNQERQSAELRAAIASAATTDDLSEVAKDLREEIRLRSCG